MQDRTHVMLLALQMHQCYHMWVSAHLNVVSQLQSVQQPQPPRHLIVAGRELRAAQPEVPRVCEEAAQPKAACDDKLRATVSTLVHPQIQAQAEGLIEYEARSSA